MKTRYFVVTLMGSENGIAVHWSFGVKANRFPTQEFMQLKASKKHNIQPSAWVPLFIYEFKNKKDYESYYQKGHENEICG